MKRAILPLVVATFLLDCFARGDLAISVLYTVPILITAICIGLEWSLALAFLCTLLAYVGYYISPASNDIQNEFGNRMLGVIVIWAVAVLAPMLRNAEEDVH